MDIAIHFPTYIPILLCSVGFLLLFIADIFLSDKKIFPSGSALIFYISILSAFAYSILTDVPNEIERLCFMFLLFISFTFLREVNKKRQKEVYYALFTGIIGALLVIRSALFIEAFLGLEFLSFSIYLLIASTNQEKKIAQSLKTYAIWSAITSSLLVYGWAWIYAVTGFYSFEHAIPLSQDVLIVPLLLIFSAIIFKLMIAPFHFWGYKLFGQSSYLLIAFVSTIPKFAFAAFMAHIFLLLGGNLFDKMIMVVSIFGIFTVLIGMLGLLKRQPLNTLLYYSILAGTGFMILAIFSSLHHTDTLLIYLFTSGITVVAVILLLHFVQKNNFPKREVAIKTYFSPIFYKIFSLIAILSIAGLPPTLGFWGKYIVLISSFNEYGKDVFFIVLFVLSIVAIIFLIYAWIKETKTIWLRLAKIEYYPISLGQKIAALLLCLMIVFGIFYFQ